MGFLERGFVSGGVIDRVEISKFFAFCEVGVRKGVRKGGWV